MSIKRARFWLLLSSSACASEGTPLLFFTLEAAGRFSCAPGRFMTLLGHADGLLKALLPESLVGAVAACNAFSVDATASAPHSFFCSSFCSSFLDSTGNSAFSSAQDAFVLGPSTPTVLLGWPHAGVLGLPTAESLAVYVGRYRAGSHPNSFATFPPLPPSFDPFAQNLLRQHGLRLATRASRRRPRGVSCAKATTWQSETTSLRPPVAPETPDLGRHAAVTPGVILLDLPAIDANAKCICHICPIAF